MKYGEQLEHESVPQWSLHNLDYNSLKREIKAHTTRDQAAAIAIPGREDAALAKFEDGLYMELCRQHHRVHLFVTSKADETSRRLDALARSIERWTGRCPDELATSEIVKRQRRVAKYERELYRLDDDIHALSRFTKAQVVAFRKIIKKYKKWTGSTTLGDRFNEDVLRKPQSFTRLDFNHLQRRRDEIQTTLREATPQLSEVSSPSSDDTRPTSRPSSSAYRPVFESLPPPATSSDDHPQLPPRSSPVKYWNEYDDGSEGETGGPEDDYAIYIDPDGGSIFPGLGYVQAVLSLPFERAKQWFRPHGDPERDPLLPSSRPPTQGGYMSTSADSTDEDGYASSEEYPARGYTAHYAFPSLADQKVIRYRENVLFWATIGCYAASFALFAISGVLISTGRRKHRVEVDAAVTVGAALSLLCACSGLGMSLYRRDPLSVSYRIMVWSTFIAACLLNGMLLVLVAGNTP
ncbi:hypothetical protein ACRE_075960 [Hapsidospora chrysogenum ATCC 11550]|uniref:SPX domain-containing protein n=1 Tax=Hapsidospora chrysogenum (strain ATCC 11550 / CBS 779.69 / DSM 880 / IAM 14645 / JCM 23072 / IMI 49137) TaxID=857340 RepID=A0A086SX66_HAPC1|nr:hypothetical protein ACRE_075960 [Hapsidospora chrysogenum ATCC 11550]